MSIRSLSPALQEKAEEQLNEVSARIEEDLKYIKEWLKQQPHLIARTDDQWLLAFLRNCKFSLQRTKEKLEFFYTMKTIASDYFTNRDMNSPDVQEFFKKGMAIPISKVKDTTSPLIVLTIHGYIDPDIVTPTVVGKSFSMIIDYAMLQNDNFTVSGVHWILDLKNIPFKYGIQCTPMVAKKWITVFEKAYPARIKGIHIIHIPTYLEPILNLVLKLAREKLRKRIHVYTENNITDLYKHVPLSNLPNEYGGSAGPKEELIANVMKKLDAFNDWFKEDTKYRSDETKRQGKPITAADMLGIEGSFRKLDID